MLTKIRAYDFDDEMGFFYNYYERLVLEEIHRQSERAQRGDRNFIADATCVALNHLPPRYIRHNVDMTFFMAPEEMLEMANKVSNAVKQALAYVESRERGPNSELPRADLTAHSEKKTTPGKKPKK